MEIAPTSANQSLSLIAAEVEEIDYESMPNSSVAVNMLAGAIAGITEHIITYPLDVLKTRMQFKTSITENVLSYMNRVYSTEGLRAFSRGLNTVVISAGPAHAMYFGAYEACKEQFVSWDNSSDHHVSHAAAGAIATIFHDGFVTPFDGTSFSCSALHPLPRYYHWLTSSDKAKNAIRHKSKYSRDCQGNISKRRINSILSLFPSHINHVNSISNYSIYYIRIRKEKN